MAAFARVQIKGLEKTNKILKDLGKRAPDILGSALFQVSEEVIGKAKKDFVPVQFGHLKNSGFVELPKKTRNGVTVELGFGGPAGKGNVGGDKNKISVGYALIVHEDLTLIHPRSGEAKYLEKPFNQAQKRLDKKIAFLLIEAEPRFR